MSYFGNGNGRAKNVERYCTPRAAICCTSGASACARSNFDWRTYSSGTPGDVASFRNGPAANANKYVLIGSVSANRVRLCPAPASETLATAEFEITVQPSGAFSSKVNRPFKSGSSKHGKAMLASMGTKRL